MVKEKSKEYMKRLIGLAASILLSLATLFGQGMGGGTIGYSPGSLTPQVAVGAQSQTKPADLCTLEGSVVNAATGDPIRKIMVEAFQVGMRVQPTSAMTDINGHFILQNLDPGRYMLRAQAPGFPPQSYGQKTPTGRGKILALAAGSHESDIAFRLLPGGVITGKVIDDDGDPLVGAQVQAMLPGGPGRPGGFAGSAQTDDRGIYRIYGLRAGHYDVVANEQNRFVSFQGRIRRRPQPPAEVYPPTYYPNSTDPSQAVPVDVSPGVETSAIDLTLTSVRGAILSGRVINEGSGKPQGIFVQLVPRFGGMFGPRYGAPVMDEKGDFQIAGVPPGSYVAVANWGNGKQMYSGRLPVDVAGADMDALSVVLAPGMALQGRVRTEAGAQLDFSALRMWMQSTENQQMMGPGAAEMNPDGTFVIHNVFDGTYRLHVVGFPETFYVKSATLGGEDLLASSGAALSHAQAGSTLEVQLSQNGGSISGSVMNDSKPVPGAVVLLAPDPPNRDRDEMYDSKTTDQFGRFTMPGLPPGDFHLFAWEDPSDLNVRDPEVLKEYESKSEPVHIKEKQQENVDLHAISAEE